ncbi:MULTISPECIES: major tail protein [Bacillaceae]|uniref:Phage tail protein n=1 Tax=Peribacillus castrilensis TaxID=2897690 RepID=A0AAW9N9P8_9BACI|nr:MULTISPECIES: major tail protein [unclassified Bacillus (in: firmicutes)]MBT2615128.1 phage tail protein [Bacillus sp. ISL-78]MBT2628259.1 phage tail protein [Bacillus sp. ISL-101]MEC0271920.1 phage tail protein [Peribacillus castrilensis]
MGIRVGFKRATFVVLDKDGKATSSVFVVEGKANKGGTKEATISGISPESVKVYASNVAYYVSAKGTGDVKAEISILDVPEEMTEAVLGRKKHTDGFTLIGERTEAPYVAALLESEDAAGQPVLFALLKGKMSAGDVSLKTSEDKPAEPDDEKLTMECIANNDGETIAYGIGSEVATKLKAYAFPPIAPPAG